MEIKLKEYQEIQDTVSCDSHATSTHTPNESPSHTPNESSTHTPNGSTTHTPNEDPFTDETSEVSKGQSSRSRYESFPIRSLLEHVPEMNLPWASFRDEMQCGCGATFTFTKRKVNYLIPCLLTILLITIF